MDLNRLAALGCCSWYFNKKSKKSSDKRELSQQQSQQSNSLKDLKVRRKQYVYSGTWDHFETGEMVDIVLKRLHNGQISNPEFLKEQVSILLYGAVNNGNIVRCYGFTKHPTEGYMLVLECAQDGDLRSYLRKQSSTLLWSDKLLILREISKSIDLLHNYEFVHGDLHTGNVLKKQTLSSRIKKKKSNYRNTREIILDIPLCFDPNNSTTVNPYGVIPYVAPEVFEKGYYTKSSDIYSFGMIMWELSTDQAPFFEYSNDKALVDDIRNNIRPEIDDQQIPKCVVDLIQRCWDSDPFNRPSAKSITSIIDEWIWILSATKIRLSNKSKDVLNQFSSANNTTKKKVKRQSKLPLSLSRTPTLLRNNNYYSKPLSKYLTRIDVEKSANASSFSSTESVNTITYQ
ncbi:unnamed protein product [Rhizophagus irregularis]|nr:unnamed protein product [Rhizophagus irregularis]